MLLFMVTRKISSFSRRRRRRGIYYSGCLSLSLSLCLARRRRKDCTERSVSARLVYATNEPGLFPRSSKRLLLSLSLCEESQQKNRVFTRKLRPKKATWDEVFERFFRMKITNKGKREEEKKKTRETDKHKASGRVPPYLLLQGTTRW